MVYENAHEWRNSFNTAVVKNAWANLFGFFYNFFFKCAWMKIAQLKSEGTKELSVSQNSNKFIT